MCDLAAILGLAAGAAQVAGQASAARQNIKNRKQTLKLDYAAKEREFLVKADAANKEAYGATLEADRARSYMIATGEGMSGPTAGARAAEQSRQGALSIANAKDARDAAGANYTLGGKASQIEAQRDVNRYAVNPLATFTTIATSGINNYGAFD